MKFIVDAKIGPLSSEIVRQIISDAVSYYMEEHLVRQIISEHLVETNAAYRELSDEEVCDWSFKIKEM